MLSSCSSFLARARQGDWPRIAGSSQQPVADIFRHRGPVWRASHAGHVSLGQLKVMSAIERCRTAALGGHVERCEACAHLRISYNSCRNRHCPKCQAAAAKEWLADRQAECRRHRRYCLLQQADEFVRRFLIHVLPDGFHRIRHYGLFANANRAANIALARRLLGAPDPAPSSSESDDATGAHENQQWNTCPCCGGRMIIVETFGPGCQPQLWPIPAIGLDSS